MIQNILVALIIIVAAGAVLRGFIRMLRGDGNAGCSEDCSGCMSKSDKKE